MISRTYQSATDEGCKAVKVKAHNVRNIGTILLFRKIYVVPQVLKAGSVLGHCR